MSFRKTVRKKASPDHFKPQKLRTKNQNHKISPSPHKTPNKNGPEANLRAGINMSVNRSVVDCLVCCSCVDVFDFLAGCLCNKSYYNCNDEADDEAGNDLIDACVIDDCGLDRACEEQEPCDVCNGAGDDACNCALVVKALPEQ